MSHTIDVPLNPYFERIKLKIERADEVSVDESNTIGDDHPGRSSLEVDIYTIGTRFFRPKDGKSLNERHKLVLASSFLANTKINPNILESKFEEWERLAFPQKSSYPPNYKDNHDDGNFIVECFFIIEVIQRFTSDEIQGTPDGLTSNKVLSKAQRDLIVHDNQLPFSVLEGLFNLAFPDDGASADRNFLKLCLTFFGKWMLITDDSQVLKLINDGRDTRTEIKDFIDLLRICHAPTIPRQQPKERGKVTIMGKAHNLEEAGMSIRPPSVNASVCSLSYTIGLLKIPRLKINQNSRHLLRNLMEYEDRHYPQATFIIDYLHFMDNLIDTTKDVDILSQNGILSNFLSDSNEVAVLFNTISKEVPLRDHNYYYYEISESVNAYCQIRRQRWKATLRRDYCSSPWMVASTIAAIILLVLTLIQTVCTIISTF